MRTGIAIDSSCDGKYPRWAGRPGVFRAEVPYKNTPCPGIVFVRYEGKYGLTHANSGLAIAPPIDNPKKLMRAATALSKSGFDFSKARNVKEHLNRWKAAPPEVREKVKAIVLSIGGRL